MAEQLRRGWGGSTKQAQQDTAMLGAKWWKVGDELSCLYGREFETKYGPGHEFALVKPATLTVFVDPFGVATKKQPDDSAEGDDKVIKRFSLPPLAGFQMALQVMQNAGFPGFRQNDKVTIKCVGVQQATEFGMSDMPEFEIFVDAR